MQTSELSPDLLTRLHRFASLLTGSAHAGTELLQTGLERCDGQMDQFRRERQGLAMLVVRLRELAIKSRPASTFEDPRMGHGEVALLPTFARLAEPKRSALALLYTGLFPLPEIASLLGLSVDDLCETFSQARTDLDAGWQDRTMGALLPAEEETPETEAPRP